MKKVKAKDKFEDSSVIETTRGFFNEFKTFAIKGNVVDLAVGVIIGAAFNDIVQSLVKDIILPPIGYITGKVDFSNLYINLSNVNYSTLAEAEKAGAAVIKYGSFINSLINFLIIAFVIFLIVTQINKLNRKEEAKPKPNTKDCPFCFSAINKNAVKCPNCTSELNIKGIQAASL